MRRLLAAFLPCSLAFASAISAPSIGGFLNGHGRLAHDLKAVESGGTPTDNQIQAINADLTDLEQARIVPAPADVQQLAADLAAAVAGGNLSRHRADTLAADLALAFRGGNLIFAAVSAASLGAGAAVEQVLTRAGVDATLIAPVIADLKAIGAAFAVSSETKDDNYTLRALGIPPGLLMNYAGHAALVTTQAGGQPPRTMLTVTANGLPPANPYTVAITKLSDGSKVTLGTLKVGFFTSLATATGAVPNAEIGSFGVAVFGTPSGQPFPAGFDPANIATLTVTDSAGTERLTATFGAASADRDSSDRFVNLHVTPGANAAARGTIAYNSHILTDGREVDDFRLSISGLPASAPVTLLTDGATAGTFTTTANGTLRVHSGLYPTVTPAAATTGPTIPVGTPPFYALPTSVDILNLRSVSLTDSTGAVLASGSLD